MGYCDVRTSRCAKLVVGAWWHQYWDEYPRLGIRSAVPRAFCNLLVGASG